MRASTTAARATTIVHLAGFQMPSGNVGCVFGQDGTGPQLTCTILHWTADAIPFDPPACPAGQVLTHRLVIDIGGRRWECGAAAATQLASGPVLQYGQVDAGGLLQCRSAETGLTCSAFLDESFTLMSSSRVEFQNGEGGGSVVAFGAGAAEATTRNAYERGWFTSTDGSVSCALVREPDSAHVYCLPSRGVLTPPPGSLSCLSQQPAAAVLDAYGDVSTTAVACGDSVPTANGARETARRGAHFPTGAVVVGPGLRCTIGTSSVTCAGGGGQGFRLTADNYARIG